VRRTTSEGALRGVGVEAARNPVDFVRRPKKGFLMGPQLSSRNLDWVDRYRDGQTACTCQGDRNRDGKPGI